MERDRRVSGEGVCRCSPRQRFAASHGKGSARAGRRCRDAARPDLDHHRAALGKRLEGEKNEVECELCRQLRQPFRTARRPLQPHLAARKERQRDRAHIPGSDVGGVAGHAEGEPEQFEPAGGLDGAEFDQLKRGVGALPQLLAQHLDPVADRTGRGGEIVAQPRHQQGRQLQLVPGTAHGWAAAACMV